MIEIMTAGVWPAVTKPRGHSLDQSAISRRAIEAQLSAKTAHRRNAWKHRIVASMPPSSGSRIVRRAPQVRWRQFGSDGILLDPESGEYLQVDAVGVSVWECLDAPMTIDQIVERLHDQFDEDVERMRSDINEFLDVLAGRQFLLSDPS